jgi:phosphatidylserine synthase
MAKKRTLSNYNIAQIFLHYRDTCLHAKENEEHQSEQRMKFFLGLVTVTLALLSFLYKEKYFPYYQDIITLVSLFILFLYGLLTFSRIIWRSRENDRTDKVIQVLNESIESLDSYVGEKLRLAGKHINEPSVTLIRLVKGTLAQFMYLTEGLLVSGITFAVGVKCHLSDTVNWILSVFALLIVVILMFIWSQYVRRKPNQSNTSA